MTAVNALAGRPYMSPPLEAMQAATEAATRSGCRRSRRGAAIWVPGTLSCWVGYNLPLVGDCDGSDDCKRICGRACLHAEQMALLAARDVRGCDLLHVKVDQDGCPVSSGPPSCAECSKLLLFAGLSGVWLLHDGVWTRYGAAEFHATTLQTCGLLR